MLERNEFSLSKSIFVHVLTSFSSAMYKWVSFLALLFVARALLVLLQCPQGTQNMSTSVESGKLRIAMDLYPSAETFLG